MYARTQKAEDFPKKTWQFKLKNKELRNQTKGGRGSAMYVTYLQQTQKYAKFIEKYKTKM